MIGLAQVPTENVCMLGPAQVPTHYCLYDRTGSGTSSGIYYGIYLLSGTSLPVILMMTYSYFQEVAFLKIMNELPVVLSNCAQPSNTKAYCSWETFMQTFVSQGTIRSFIGIWISRIYKNMRYNPVSGLGFENE